MGLCTTGPPELPLEVNQGEKLLEGAGFVLNKPCLPP